MQDYRKLRVWRSSMALARECYTATESFPRSELFGLTSQVRRSAVSIPSNIAEGCGRGSRREFVRFLRIAYGSACELGTQLELSNEIGHGQSHRLAQLLKDAEEVRRMLASLIQRVELGSIRVPTVN
ncbi:MAG: four helix bundle protein [Acidimicrobiia bacterium]